MNKQLIRRALKIGLLYTSDYATALWEICTKCGMPENGVGRKYSR
jgi:hypothetical protein